MTDGPSKLDELRGRLSALEQAQRASAGTADPGFWARLTGSTADRPGSPRPASDADGPGSPRLAGDADRADNSRRSGTAGRPRVAAHARTVAPQSRPIRARFGPWASVPLQVLDALDPEQLRATVQAAGDRTEQPTAKATNPSSNPANHPTDHPTDHPASNPANHPTDYPTDHPASNPTSDPASDPASDSATDHGFSDGLSAQQSGAQPRFSQQSAGREAGAQQSGAPVPVLVEAGLGASLHRHDQGTLTRAAEWVAHQRATLDAMLVNLIGELESRGAHAPDGLTRTDWLRQHDPSLTPGAARALVTVAVALTEPRWARLAVQVTTGQTTVSHAREIIEFHDRTHRLADPADLDTALADLQSQARRLRPEELARLARHHTEQIRPPRDHQEDESRAEARDEARRACRGLWFDPPSPTGMVSLRGRLDPEAAAIVKSAIDPLSRPCPTIDDHGHVLEPDPRTPATRRMDALLDVIARGAAAPEATPDRSGTRTRPTDKAKVVVLIDHDALIDRLGPLAATNGEPGSPLASPIRTRTSAPGAPTRTGTGRSVTGSGTRTGTGRALTGDVLTATTIRRIACDAGIIPVVLGTRGEPLDVGREKRLVTPGLRLALTTRDQGCSYPGCTMPPQWTDAHHVVHWAQGGQTSLLNTALLCRRHHTHVHRHQLDATVTATTVTWHT